MTPGSKRIEGLDILRGLAVALVMMRHAIEGHPAAAWLPGLGITGVVTFFALSGYLITGILLSDIDNRGGIRYLRFYRNRGLRLIPALLLLLVVYAVVEGTSNQLNGRAHLALSLGAGLLYMSDLPQLAPYMHGLSHLWTLAVEEQFYLVWPFVLAIFGGRRLIRIGTLAVLAVAVALAIVFCLVWLGDEASLYTMPTTWAPALLAGAAAQVFRDQLGWFKRFGPVHAVGLVLLGASILVMSITSTVTYLVGASLIGLSVVPLIVWLTTVPKTPAWAKPLLALGTVSYAAYLWNLPIARWMGEFTNYSIVGSAVGFLLTIAVATLSWWTVERWARSYRNRLDRPSTAKAGAGDPTGIGQ